MASQGGKVLISLALGIKRRLMVRTRLRWLLHRLWRYRYGIRPLHNFLEDRKWGGYCGGVKYSPYAHLGAHATESLPYGQLSYLFKHNHIPIHDNDVLVDVGCGKGRVINFWLSRGCRNRIVGIELDEDVASAARNRLARHPNVEIITGDAIQVLPEDGTLFFLFNPFGPAVMRRFVEKLKLRPDLCIIYYYCIHVDIFKNDPMWSVEELRTGDWKQAVLIRPKVDVTIEPDGAGAQGAGTSDQNDQPVAAQSRAAR